MQIIRTIACGVVLAAASTLAQGQVAAPGHAPVPVVREGATVRISEHVHVILDDKLISMTEGLEQSIPDVPPGDHRITVEFVASDHAPFDPRVVTVVAFEVRP